MSKDLIIVAIVCIALMAHFTKPTRSDFIDFVQKQIRREGTWGKVISFFTPLLLNERDIEYYDGFFFAVVNFPQKSEYHPHPNSFVGFFGKWILVLEEDRN